jgi:hypothetical protein
MFCLMCDGELTLLGVLGYLFWYRCQDCGMEQHSTEVNEEILEALAVN